MPVQRNGRPDIEQLIEIGMWANFSTLIDPLIRYENAREQCIIYNIKVSFISWAQQKAFRNKKKHRKTKYRN